MDPWAAPVTSHEAGAAVDVERLAVHPAVAHQEHHRGAGLVGGLGVAPGANIGTHAALFEPTHGSAPKYAGQNKVNPLAMMLSGVMMLRYLKETEAADRMEGAIAELIREGKSVTYDMKPDRNDPTAVGTSGVADALIEKLQVTA